MPGCISPQIEHRLFSQITMNWRGRPLTSHEVVVKTIASTRTRTGLRVEAALDTGDYPTGIAVSPDELRALPIQPHAQHGAWNYTIAPTGTDSAAPVGDRDRQRDRADALAMLADPRLTGMSRDELNRLAARLAPAQAARAQQRRWQQRGGPRRRAAGAGGTRLLSDAGAVLITIVYLRQVCSQRVLSELLAVNPNSIGEIIAEMRMLLDEHGHHHVTPTTQLRFTTAADFNDFLCDGPVVPQPTPQSQLTHALSDPTLTGMSRQQLHDLVERLAPRQAALVERRRYTRRGGERMPGGRGGVFLQKITDAERILATVLYLRRVCTRAVLAELFHVSPRTIGTALLEVRPLLDQDVITITTTPTRYRSAADLLAAVPQPDHNTAESKG